MKRQTVFIILGVLGGLAALVTGIVALVFYATSGVTGAADKFFETARGGDIHAVYALTSSELQNVTSAEQLGGFVKTYRLNQVTETSWTSRSFENNLGNVQGTVTLDDGGVIPLTLDLVKEGEDWKISSIDVPKAGVARGQ